MKSSFFEFNVAISGLFTARANLEVNAHNTANAAIKGYSRQYAEQRASHPLATFNGKGMVGTGSEVYGIGQFRDFYLDRKFWSERGVLGEYATKQTQLSITESIFNELADSSLTKIFNHFFDTLQSLNENAGDFTYRTNMIQSAETLVSMIRFQSNSIYKQQSDINEEIKATVQIINSIGQQIMSLNRQISTYELDGSRANDLRDQRARLVDELSLYVNVDVQEREVNKDYAAGKFPAPEDRGKSDKRFTVMINGYEFVNHFDVFPITVRERVAGEEHNPMDVPGLYDIYFESGFKFDMYHPFLKGELKGLIDMRDGNNGTTEIDGKLHNTQYKGLPHYMEKLNHLIRTLARVFNEGKDKNGVDIHGVEGHIDGYDLYGNRGNLFFTYNDRYGNPIKITGYDYDGTPLIPVYTGPGFRESEPPARLRLDDESFYNNINVFNFAINPDLFQDPALFAASSEDLMDPSNNEIVKGFLQIKSYVGLFREGQLSDYISGMITELGIDRKQAEKFMKNYTDVTTMIDNQRIEISGVNLNEEMVDLVRNQQLYQAAAKLVNIIDSIYDTTVNRLGMW